MAAKLEIEKNGGEIKNKCSQVQLCSHLGQWAGPPDTILEENHPMTMLSKFGSN
jgi:hypothetical protein